MKLAPALAAAFLASVSWTGVVLAQQLEKTFPAYMGTKKPTTPQAGDRIPATRGTQQFYIDGNLIVTPSAAQELTNKTIDCALNDCQNMPGGGAATNGVSGDVLTSDGLGGFGTPITPGVGVPTFLTTPSSANFSDLVTDETGSGFVVLNTGPTITALTLGNITGSVQCLHVNAAGLVSGTGADCGTGGGGGTPGGTAGAFQWNDGGVFNGIVITGLVKGTGTGGPALAVAGTDYAPPTTGSAILKGNALGGFALAVPGTDYAAATTGAANAPLFTDGLGGFTNGQRSGNTTTVVTTTGVQTSGRCVTIDANGNHIQAAAPCGTGDVTGPASAVNNNIATFSGTTGDIIQDSGKALPTGTIVGTTDPQNITGKTIAGVNNTLTVRLPEDITGILPGGNGGTGNGFMAFAGPGASLKTFTLPNASSSILTSNSPVTVAQGGTGLSGGTSGGIPAYTAAGTIASSGVLTTGLPVLGGGAGAVPFVGTRSGNTTKYVSMDASAPAANDCAKFDASGNLTTAGGACTTTALSLTGVTNGSLLYDNADTLGGVTLDTGLSITAGTLSLVGVPNNQTGATYTLLTSDGNKSVNMTNASATTVTVLAAADAGTSYGTYVTCDAGCTLARSGTDTINGATSLALAARQSVYLTPNGTTAWRAAFLPATDPSSATNLTSGNLSVNRLNSGTGASGSTFWRGDGTWATPAGGGTVTSVGLSVPATSIFGVTGSPITSAGTLGLTTTGTSGGIPYFSSTSQIASSGALTANMPVFGGGAGAAPTVGTRSGNTTQVVTTTGAQTEGRCVTIDAGGNHVAHTGGCGGTGSGAMTLVSTVTANNTSPAMTFTGLTGNDYKLTCRGVVPATASIRILVQFSIGATFIDANYDWSSHGLELGTASYNVFSAAADSGISVRGTLGTIGTDAAGVTLDLGLYGLATAVQHRVMGKVISVSDTGVPSALDVFGRYTGATTAVDGVRVISTSGNLASGNCSLYAIAQS